MKLLQVNVWGGKLTRTIIELIKAEDPDIICMQEVISSGDTVVYVPDFVFSYLELIREATEYAHTFFAPALGMTYANLPIRYGNAILSKFPLLDQEVVFTHGEFQPLVDPLQRFPNIRNLQVTRIEQAGKTLTIANHHGYWLADPVGDETTVASLKIVADKLRMVSGPVVLAGDLNVTPASPAMRVFDDFLEDLTATHHLKTTLGPLGVVGTDVPCDHILVSPEVRVHSFQVSDAVVSDHKALILEFEI